MSRRFYILAALLFIAVLVWRLPASWIVRWLPERIACENPSGTLWAGQCARVSSPPLAFTNLSWTVLAEELLHGKLGVRIYIADPGARGTAKLLLSRDRRWQLYDFVADLPLPSPLLTGVPLEFSGQLRLEASNATGSNRDLETLQGALRVTELRSLRPPLLLGGYEVKLRQAAQRSQLEGTLSDLDAPLRVNGTVRVSLRGEYEINGKVAATAAADPELVAMIERLGPADAEGLRAFSLAGTR